MIGPVVSALLGTLVALAPVAKSLSDKVMAPDKRDNGIRDTGYGIRAWVWYPGIPYQR